MTLLSVLLRAASRSSVFHWTPSPAASLRAASSASLKKDAAIVFYKWPTIRHFRVLSRSKFYQLVLMSLLLPPATASYHQGHLSGSTLTAAYLAAGGTLTLLVSLSHLFTKVIGEMAYLPETDQVRVSTLTFLGGRRDIVVDPQQIVPNEGRGPVQGLEIMGQTGTFRYSTRYGQVIDSEIMAKILLHITRREK